MRNFFLMGKHLHGAKEPADPDTQIKQGNPWYVSDQLCKQLGKPGTRALIHNRWKKFEEIFLDYLRNLRADSSGINSEPLRYLDAGCGDGINLQWVTTFFEISKLNFKITALDYNSLRVDRVEQSKIADDVRVASLLNMPFNDETFDIILCNHVLEHIPQFKLALAELHRVLKPGGLLVVGVPNEGCRLAQLRNSLLQRSILKTTDHVNFFTERLLEKILCLSGFRIARVYREGFFLPHFWLHYLLMNFQFGERILSFFGHVFPSQSAGLIVYSLKN